MASSTGFRGYEGAKVPTSSMPRSRGRRGCELDPAIMTSTPRGAAEVPPLEHGGPATETISLGKRSGTVAM